MVCGFTPMDDIGPQPGQMWYAKLPETNHVIGAYILHISHHTVCFQTDRVSPPIRMLKRDVLLIEKVEDV